MYCEGLLLSITLLVCEMSLLVPAKTLEGKGKPLFVVYTLLINFAHPFPMPGHLLPPETHWCGLLVLFAFVSD